MEVEETLINRKDVEFIIGESDSLYNNIKLSLFKNKDTPWILTDGWRGISYIIEDEITKLKINKL